MLDISYFEKLFNGTFKVLNGLPRYIALEQVQPEPDFKEKLGHLIGVGKSNKLQYISVLIQKTNNDYSNILITNGFEHRSSIIEYTKDLGNIEELPCEFQWKSLENELTEKEFKDTWRQCMLYSDNKPSTFTMAQHLEAVKSELGNNWRNSCRVFLKGGKPIGVTIPHMEPGTTDEGRLFYFGLIPEMRGKGLSSSLHKQSLQFLREMGATYYIGSTQATNKKMQHVFIRSGCMLKSHMESFYKYF
ncbi:GNAT family N-acetyltransferase [Heyndrickxia camelliae]|uniref:GNAT family N-acetyltransferase n=1 Tax=Heyndrickxia camelliae TaxID=1707093 RepID=A0A2N3LCJ4_9BACI|nr:GNAT family N-acetyltransferase [Heyndrickxia camelliae]PKR82380.1 GNAT family N-acetyltransferase [Heyndrickxia camelliae]